MKRLWAPWRMKYIRETSGKKDTSCFLCDAYSDRNNRNNLVVAVFEHSFVIMNKFPYNNGHLMIVPIKHTGEIEALEKETRAELMDIIALTTNVLKTTMNAEGINVGINLGRVAGAGVPDHVHIHVVPRWNGDTNFMPVFTDTKIISEGLDEAYLVLKKGFEEARSGV